MYASLVMKILMKKKKKFTIYSEKRILQISESEVVELASFLSSERLDLINDLKKNYNPREDN